MAHGSFPLSRDGIADVSFPLSRDGHGPCLLPTVKVAQAKPVQRL